MKPSRTGRMPLLDALRVIAQRRRHEIVVTTMGSAREWPKLSANPLDFHFLPSAMGQATSLGLGMALALPEREVIVFNGDGCMLMNLGSLVTIAASGAENYTLVVLENGTYEVTGGQPTPATPLTDFARIAHAAGIANARSFSELTDWERRADAVFASRGPRFVTLAVEPVADYQLPIPEPLIERVLRFRRELGIPVS
jgi:thiamine pyrophosphate-dependent acetolactate synthase large subunit-like protein